jgi:hypothetical protein
MTALPKCQECESIIEELRAAMARIQASPKLRDKLRADWDAFFKAMTEPEEDFAEGFCKFRFYAQQPQESAKDRHPGIGNAIRKLSAHRCRTGHAPLFLE